VSEEINNLLTAGSIASCTFDPADFLTLEADADCYGPLVAYEDHPDGSSIPNSGTLPTGDVGIWLETDPTTLNACSAAQLNARMTSAQDKSNATLSGLASMVCTAIANGLSLPSATNPSVNLLTEMNALGITDTTFTAAIMSYASVGSYDVYSYNLEFTYAPLADSYDIVVDMEHVPTSNPAVYSGVASFLVNDSFTGGNCPASDVTHNGSIEYDAASSTDMAQEVRSAVFCEHDSDGRDTVTQLVDPSLKYSATTPTGWGDNFRIFTGNFDPADLVGTYAFSWQAGHHDGNSRVFNLALENSGASAFAFYGYGEDVETTDGSIDGFICNWAGPNSNHTIVEYAQYQEMSVSTTGVVSSDLAYITYAPTVSCEYDGTGSFLFDTDADGLLTDEVTTLDITIASGTMDLEVGIDTDSDTIETIEETIDDSGYVLPTM